MFDVFELQKKLVAAVQPSSREESVRRVLRELAAPYCDEMYTDTLGSLICRKRGPGKKVVMPAHMDVIGFMATYIDERGFIRFGQAGGYYPGYMYATPVRFESGVRGVMMPEDKSGPMKKKLGEMLPTDFYIDIGARSREEALRHVRIGDFAIYDTTPIRVGDGCIMTPYADDLSGCILLLLAMEQLKESENDLYFVFTAQEESGIRGAGTVAYRLEPDLCIATDGYFTGDTPASTVKMAVRVGGGPTIKIRDRGMMPNRRVINHLRAAAEEAGIAYQDEILLAGSTDAAAMQQTRGGVLSGCISVPMRNIHSPCEMYSIADVENGARLMAAAAARHIDW